MASEMSKSKRQIFFKLSLLIGITEVISQVTSYSKMYEVGSVHLIRGKTTILRVDPDTPKQRHGLSKVAPSRNGNYPDRVHFYGFMANVSPPTITLSQTDVFSADSGRGQERSLVCDFFDISVFRTNGVEQFLDHREHQLDEEVWTRVTRFFLLRFQGERKGGPARTTLVSAGPALSSIRLLLSYSFCFPLGTCERFPTSQR
jgi:hypothetical protein